MSKNIITVLFTGNDLRLRRRETILHSPPGIRFRTIQEAAELTRSKDLTKHQQVTATNKVKRIAHVWTSNNWIKEQYLNGIDLVYSPGFLVLSPVPFVVEVDNVGVLTYYQLAWLKLLKPFIKTVLAGERCKAIVCLSEAVKQSIKRFFKDPAITKKCVVIYPYIGPELKKNKRTGHVEFLFVATNFYLKGGKEVVHAFQKMANPRCRLTVITDTRSIKPTDRKVIENTSNIRLVQANLSKQVLHKKYFCSADVFVLPTYMDSFGMVYLEALKAGLPIIATDVFAVPEMVKHGKNGFIIKSPIPSFTKDYLPNPEWSDIRKFDYSRETSFPEVEEALVKHMKALAENHKLRKRMAKASIELLKKRFSEARRLKILGTVLKKAAGGQHVRN